MSDITLNLNDKESIVALMVDVQELEISCHRAATEIQERHYAAMDALNAANEKMRERLKVSDELADGLIAELDNLKASTIHSCGDSCSRPMCVLRRERDAYKQALEMIAYDPCHPRLDHPAIADSVLTAIEDVRMMRVFEDEEKEGAK